jgi:hypothetical protein
MSFRINDLSRVKAAARMVARNRADKGESQPIFVLEAPWAATTLLASQRA